MADLYRARYAPTTDASGEASSQETARAVRQRRFRLEDAARYGLYDLDRLERMVLERIQSDYFLLGGGRDECDE